MQRLDPQTETLIPQNGGSFSEVVAFHPTQDPISSTDGSIHAMGCGSKNGACTQAVAFKPSHFTRGKDGAPSEVFPPLSADADKGDQDPIVATAFSAKDSAVITSVEVAPTMRAMGNAASHANGGGQIAVAQPMTFDWQAGGGGADQSFRGKSRSYVCDKPGCSRALTSCKTLAVARQEPQAMYSNDGRFNGMPPAGVSPALKVGSNGSSGNPPAVAVDTYNQTISDVSIPVRVGNGKDSLPAVAVAFKSGQSEAAGGTFVTDELAPTIQSQNNGSTAIPAVGHLQPMTLELRGRDGATSLEARSDGTANCLRSSNGGRGGVGVGAVATLMSVRRFTPRECERLQGFPDDYTNVIYRKKPAADGPRYKALGNSMAVPCMHWLGLRIDQAFNTLPHKSNAK